MKESPFKRKDKKNNNIILSFIILIIIAAIVSSIFVYKDKKNNEVENQTSATNQFNKNEDEKKIEVADTNVKKSNNSEENKNQSEVNNAKQNQNNGYIEGQPQAKEPTYIKGVLIVNKKYPLPKNFNPGEDVEARAAFEQMAASAKKAGFEIVAFSSFRSYEYQTTLYNNYVERDGKEQADRYSARPGYSEHQTGLAFDVGEVGKEDLWLTSEFGETAAGKWLVENASKYGFVLRYPKGKENITGYMYESWHFRYLGTALAAKVTKSGLTLEEYLNIQ